MSNPGELNIGFVFQNQSLLKTALCHSSYSNENRGQAHNERLEFLGDAVLELCASEYLYRYYPRMSEGEMSRHRAQMVCETALAACARRLNLGDALYLGKGEEKSGGRNRDSLLADAMEALIGAIFLDGGLDRARHFVQNNVLNIMDHNPLTFDAKTELQEILQQQGSVSLRYRILEESGPVHEKSFRVEVLLEENPIGAGTGSSKKQAEQAAAADALVKLRK